MQFSGEFAQVKGNQMRTQFILCAGKYIRIIGQFGQQSVFMGRNQRGKIHIVQNGLVSAPLREDGTDTRMGILYVIDRIFVGLRKRQIDVEYEFGIGLP